MKPLSERIKEFPTEQFVDWLCLACVDVREVRTPEDAQEEINKIREAVTERISTLEDKLRIKQNHIKLRDTYIEELEQRAEAAEATIPEEFLNATQNASGMFELSEDCMCQLSNMLYRKPTDSTT